MSQTIDYGHFSSREVNYAAAFAASLSRWVLTRDREEVERFTEENLGQFCLAIDVYISLLEEMDTPAYIIDSLVKTIEQVGLYEYLKYMSIIKNCWAHGETLEHVVFQAPLPRALYDVCSWLWGNLEPRQFNLVCSFMKRFTPTQSLRMEKECIQAFRQREVDNMLRSNPALKPSAFMQRFNELVSAYLRYAFQSVDWHKKTASNVITTHGVSNCCRRPSHRFAVAHSEDPFFLDWLDTFKEGQEFSKALTESSPIDSPERSNNVNAVPKDYKSYRIVSPEDVLRLAWQNSDREMFTSSHRDARLLTNLPLDNQEVMRNLCAMSTKGEIPYATLDESSASDLITKAQFLGWLPEAFPLLERLPRYFTTQLPNSDKVTRPAYMLAPMGSGDTMPLQATIFWAVDSAASDMYYLYSGDRRPRKKLALIDPGADPKLYTDTKVEFTDPVTGMVFVLHPFVVFAMGDDQEAPTAAAETIMDVHELLGWKPNRDKSFFDMTHSFRESCGVEYLHGKDVSINYWPRKPLKISADCKSIKADKLTFEHTSERGGRYSNTITCLAGLQHRLHEMGYTRTAERLAAWIMHVYPKMTMSAVGALTDDLWGHNVSAFTQPYPLAKMKQVHRYSYTSPWTGETYTWNSKGELKRSIIMGSRWQNALEDGTLVETVDEVIDWDDKALSHDFRYCLNRDAHLCVKTAHKVVRATQNGAPKTQTAGCIICTALQSCSDASRLQDELYTYRAYSEFLREGPAYADPLSKLLSVSSQRPRIDETVSAELSYTF